MHSIEVYDCLFIIQESNSEAKLSDISSALSVTLQQNCNCFFSVQRRIFSCLGTENSQTVVFLAELTNMALSEADLSSLLTSWVASTPPITVASTQLQVDITCPVVIDSLKPEGCPVVSPTSSPTDVIVIAISVASVAFLLAIIIVAIVMAAIICYRKQSRYKYGRHLT